jgi:hypothetical protein
MLMTLIETTQPNQTLLKGVEKAFAGKTLRQPRHPCRVLVPSVLLLVIKVSNRSPFFFIYVIAVPVPHPSTSEQALNSERAVDLVLAIIRCLKTAVSEEWDALAVHTAFAAVGAALAAFFADEAAAEGGETG